MRIAGSTVRRNYLKNYERNYSDKYESEQKISTYRQFQRASENPINAAKALRVRKSIAEIETSQKNLKSASSIYQAAESSMMTLSEIIQSTYEKLVEGAHGTRNQDDLEIIAKEVDNYAEEMVQSLNVNVSDRRIFGALNNETVAFKIETSATGDKFVTYNGVAVNSSSDPQSFPYSGTSYLDIGIGMSVDGSTGRIDDQTALPITFNGAECTGCGVTNRTANIDLDSVVPGNAYKINVSAGGQSKIVSFNGGDTKDDTINNINAALKQAFQVTPEISADGSIKYLDNIEGYTGTEVRNYENASIDGTPAVDIASLKADTYYSLEITAGEKTRVIDFMGSDNINTTLDNIRTALSDKFGEDAPEIYSDGIFLDVNKNPAAVKNCSDYSNNVSFTPEGNMDLAALTAGEQYTVNVNGVKVSFTAGADVDETVENLNKEFAREGIFGDITVPRVDDNGTLLYDGVDTSIVIRNEESASNQLEFSEVEGYSKNIMQLILDSAKALRAGDQDLVARYADKIYAAQGSLSIAIAELGTNDKFIEFNEERTADILINLQETQNDIEITDMPSEITNWKVLEAVYNATLQMGSSVLSMSIFDYIK